MSQAADSDVDSDLQEAANPWPEALSHLPASNHLSETIAPLPPSQEPSQPYLRLPINHAEPLMPMQERDLKAIQDLFEQEGIEAIEADILENLPRHSPELHWDDWGMIVLRDLFDRA